MRILGWLSFLCEKDVDCALVGQSVAKSMSDENGRSQVIPHKRIAIGESVLNQRKMSTVVLVWACLWVTVGLYGYFLNAKNTPPGYFLDTLSIVMNAVCINEFGADEFGEPYPIVGFRSVGDYKPPLFIYLVAIAGKFVSPSLYVARIAGMICGLLGVAVSVLICQRLVSKQAFNVFGGPLFALALLSSWVMVPHRLGQDVTVAIPIIALLIAATLSLLNDAASEWRGLLLGIVCGILPYAHSLTKFLYLTAIPLAVITLWVSRGFKVFRWAQVKGLFWAIIVSALMAIPLFFDLLTNQDALARYSAVGEPNILKVGFNYLRHVNPLFWFVEGDKNLRHHTGYHGMLYVAFLPLLLTGLIAAINAAWNKKSSDHIYVLLFFVISFIPASMTREGLPHALRTLTAVPPMIILSFWGAEWLYEHSIKRLHIWACLSLFIVWLGWGCFEAIDNLRYYQQHPCDACWTYFDRPEPQWRSNSRSVPCDDRSIETLNYRYFRLVEIGDTCYCRRSGTK